VRVVVRSDAGPGVGLGHVVRCLAIVDALRRFNVTSVFVLRSDAATAIALVASHGHDVHLIDRADDSVADASVVAAESGSLTGLVLLDGYGFDDAYERRLVSAGMTVVAMDDYGHARHDAARMIINGNLYYSDQSRYAHVTDGAMLLLGVSFAPLRSQLVELRRTIGEKRGEFNVLVTFGGDDTRGSLAPALDELLAIVPKALISATLAGTAEDVREVRAQFPTVSWISDPAQLPKIMADADLAIGAGGMTSYELACLGVPAVLLPATEIQVPDAEAFARAGSAITLGLEAEFPRRAFTEAVRALGASSQRRSRMAEQGRALVDGLGAVRIAQVMTATFAHQFAGSP
jgi:UDP-2,4-diacetamido-2,4,6-trideoxy-beta-L-altropyranose hydrolase